MVWVEEEVQHGRAALLTLKLNTAVKIKWVCSILWRRALGEGGRPAETQYPWAWSVYGTQLGASLPPPYFHTLLATPFNMCPQCYSCWFVF